MTTFGDVKGFIARIAEEIQYRGARSPFFGEVQRRGYALGDALSEELGLSPEEVMRLSPETPVGPRARTQF